MELTLGTNKRRALVLDLAMSYLQRGWNQNTGARNEQGGACGAHASSACAWCLVAAISRAAAEVAHPDDLLEQLRTGPTLARDLIADYMQMPPDAPPSTHGNVNTLVSWNDAPHRTQEQVVAYLRSERDRLAALEEAHA